MRDTFLSVMERIDCDIAVLDQSSLQTPDVLNKTKKSLSIEDSTENGTSDIICLACGCYIEDRYIYKVINDSYHERCLRCSCCKLLLSSFKKCYTRYGNIYCEQDHKMLYGKRCARCMTILLPTDIVHHVQYVYYHQQCFNCFLCHKQFKLGDEYRFCEGDVLCRDDYQSIHSNCLEQFVVSEADRKTPKRPRTILNANQRRQFKAAFEKSSKPSRKVREQLANETGLSVRVVQVWFQNQRAKIKKLSKKDSDLMSDVFKNTSSEGRSTEDIRSSDDEESIPNTDADDVDSADASSFADPIQKLYNMTSSDMYFPFDI